MDNQDKFQWALSLWATYYSPDSPDSPDDSSSPSPPSSYRPDDA